MFKKIRWLMLILFISGVTLNYISRNALSVLAPILQKEMGVTTQQYSWVIAIFQFTYAFCQPICGWIVDHIGLKLGFMLFATVWSLVCMLHPFVGGWKGLAGLRFLMGASEAVAVPANVKFLSEWFPVKERGIVAGWSGVGFSLGAIIAPPLVGVLHMYFGWQAAFVAIGVLGLVWVLLWKTFYDKPENSRWLSTAEKQIIMDDETISWQKQVVRRGFWAGVKSIVCVKKFYGIAVPAFLSEPAWQVLNMFVPLYLATERGMDLKGIILFAMLPFVAGDLGSIASGYVSKYFRNKFSISRNNAVIWSDIAGAIMMLALAAVPFVSSPYTAIALISIGGFGHQMISALLSVLVIENFDGGNVASVNGMRGFSAWIGASIFSLIIGVVVPLWGYSPLFMVMGFFDLIGVIFMLAFIYERAHAKVQ